MKPTEKFSDSTELVFKHTDRASFVWAIENGELTIKSRSVPGDINQYLESIRKWVDEYVKHPLPTTRITINLEHLNGITSHYLYGIIRRLARASEKVIVNWEFRADDEDSLEQGYLLSSICKAKFRYVRIPVEKEGK